VAARPAQPDELEMVMKRVTVSLNDGTTDTLKVTDAQAKAMERQMFNNGLGRVETDRGTVAVDYSRVSSMQVK
jgi:hypothetical protein